MRLQQMLRGQRLPPIPHLLSVMVQPKPVSMLTGCRGNPYTSLPEWYNLSSASLQHHPSVPC